MGRLMPLSREQLLAEADRLCKLDRATFVVEWRKLPFHMRIALADAANKARERLDTLNLSADQFIDAAQVPDNGKNPKIPLNG